jgi:APA family basic amino acid/polyamine antiporter
MMKRWLGVPFLYSAASAAVGFSIYFSIGVVADRGLGLTPVIFLLAGLMFALTSLSYVEGGAMLRERGGSATFARHAFNELVSFIAGWAILIDYLIVIAAASITVSHYLTPISGTFGGGDVELAVAALVIALAAILNIADVTGRNRQRRLVVLALAELGLQLLVIVVGLIVVLHPDRLTDQLHLFSSPTVKDLVYSLVIATIAYAGIEAASDLAPELEFEPGDLKRVLGVGAIAIPLIYAGIAAVALMAVPVEPTAHGPQTALAGRYIEEPILGVVANYDHGFLSDLMKWAVMLVAVPVLFWAANGAMLGLSRHVYVLATNRQIPSWAGKLESTYSTPYIAIGIAAVLALALAIPGDIRFLARVYAFGALLAVTIAQISIVRLRVVEPDLERPYRVPWNVRFGSHELPLLSIIGALISGLGWISVFLLHHTAVWVGGGWMLFGLVFYVIYRRYVEGTPLTRRVQVPEASLKKQPAELDYSTILVPVFGTKLDDDIVSTAGRLADASVDEGERPPRLDVVYVAEVPLTVPLDSPLSKDARERGERALERAREIGDEYENVEVTTNLLPARSMGSGIVQEARDKGAEVIVMGGEPPTRVRGGAILGGIGGARPDEIGEVTEYVLKKAPCRVLLTAPPEEDAAGDGATASPSDRGHDRPPDETARGFSPRSE